MATGAAPLLDPTEVAQRAQAAVDRVAALMDRVPDPEAPVPGMDAWRVHDLVAHLASAPTFYLGGPTGETTFATDGSEMPSINAGNVAELRGQSIAQLRAAFVEGYAAMCASALEPGADTERWPGHGGNLMTTVEAVALGIGELDVHGFDLARALGVPWVIPPRDVALILHGLAPIMPAWVNPATAAGHSADYEIRLRGQGAHRWRFADGALEIEPDGPWRPDVIISGAAQALLLVFYGRIGQYGPMLRGQMLAWGRRPWLALNLSKRLLPA
jgi:uncharacterized protein (TIGR03083 family)